MAVKKIILDDSLDEIDYALIGIHCSIESYRLAYFLNKYLTINLSRKSEDLDFCNKTCYTLFEWFDEKKLTIWNLVSNNCQVASQEKPKSNTLFSNQEPIAITYHLIPEHKKVNYFLKISDDNVSETCLNSLLKEIQNIPQIVAAYSLSPNELKSTNNLIFY